ncbi:NAD(P)H-dependent oxidoreductase [Burkholderia cenocepacia]|uniref:NAD(P)H-dependent oxidoreductase n=1 Tax=Burkholderia cenocepacia TaxID=95486 RepID=UPI000F5B1101|nr:NAD(P)H-dependent oxidoreductase [Burkholderia cenocepacia]
MIQLLAISGSLRAKLYNSTLLRAATYLAPAGVSVEIAPTQDIPQHNSDTEDDTGLPEALRNPKSAIRRIRSSAPRRFVH